MRLPALLCALGLLSPLALSGEAQSRLPSTDVAVSAAEVAPTPAPAVPEWWRNGGPRLRPTDGRVAALLRGGRVRSARLRDLVARVEAGDVFVYVGMEPRMHSSLAGSLTFIGDAGRYRFLRVILNPGLAADQLIAALAHELQHVVEVIDHPEVTSERALSALYRRIGRENRVAAAAGWETDAAQQVGFEVRRELRGTPAGALARGPLPGRVGSF